MTWIDLRSTEYQAGAQSTGLSAHSTQFVVACMWALSCKLSIFPYKSSGAMFSSVVRAFGHGAMSRRIDPSWWTH